MNVLAPPNRSNLSRTLGAVEISVVVPLCNEEDNFPILLSRLTSVLDDIGLMAELIFVNDGSTDRTAELLEAAAAGDPRIVPIHFSRNFGHQPAISAGLDRSRGETVVVMDGDLQDPPELIPEFLEAWRAGNDVIYGVRRRRRESIVKRLGYAAFYRIMKRAADLRMPLDAGDFCLMDRAVVDRLNELPERNRFVRGLRAFVGFRQTGIEFDRPERTAGETKYTFRKLAGLAADGLFNFSTLPIRLIGWAAAALFLTALIGCTLAALGASWNWGLTAVGCGIGSLILGALAIVGEYVRRIFLEVKARPAYFVREPEYRVLGHRARAA